MRQRLLVRVGLRHIGVAVLAVVARVRSLACLLGLFAVEEFLEHAHLILPGRAGPPTTWPRCSQAGGEPWRPRGIPVQHQR